MVGTLFIIPLLDAWGIFAFEGDSGGIFYSDLIFSCGASHLEKYR